METTKKNATDSQKKVKFRSISNFDPIFLAEKCSSRSEVIPGQAYSIGELLERATRGQRLNVPMRPTNFVEPGVEDEHFEHAPEDIQDPVELDDFIARHKERAAALDERIKEREAAKAEKKAQAAAEAAKAEQQ